MSQSEFTGHKARQFEYVFLHLHTTHFNWKSKCVRNGQIQCMPQPVVVMRVFLQVLSNWTWPLSRQALSQEAASSHGQSSRGGWCGSSKPWPLTRRAPSLASTLERNTRGKMKACWSTGSGALQEREAHFKVYYRLAFPHFLHFIGYNVDSVNQVYFLQEKQRLETVSTLLL